MRLLVVVLPRLVISLLVAVLLGLGVVVLANISMTWAGWGCHRLRLWVPHVTGWGS